MALVANSLNFTWSRWNLLSGYDKLIMQYRERLPGAPEVNHQVPILPLVTKIALQIFETVTLYIFLTFNQYSSVGQVFCNHFEPNA
jgi:hypothetical protein